jgi:hypothetical protein
MAAMEALVKELPDGIGAQWSGLAYEEQQSGANAPILYALSLLVVFLCLAALYESWSIPVSVMLVVPLGVLGAVGATLIGKQANDVYFQVGLLATIGLAAKNAILIVEFAKDLVEHGKAPAEAALEAARMRLRPIVMTSLAFVLGVLPLAIARGAGAGAQNAIGVAKSVVWRRPPVLLVPVLHVDRAARPQVETIAAGPHAVSSRACQTAARSHWRTSARTSVASDRRRRWQPSRPTSDGATSSARTAAGVIALALRNNRPASPCSSQPHARQKRIQRADLLRSGRSRARCHRHQRRGRYCVGATVSYELNLFGRVRSPKAAALGGPRDDEARRAVHPALVSRWSRSERAFEDQRARQRTLATVRERRDDDAPARGGQCSDLDVRTADAQVQRQWRSRA